MRLKKIFSALSIFLSLFMLYPVSLCEAKQDDPLVVLTLKEVKKNLTDAQFQQLYSELNRRCIAKTGMGLGGDFNKFSKIFKVSNILTVLEVGECIYAGDYKAAAGKAELGLIAYFVPMAGQVILAGQILDALIKSLSTDIFNANTQKIYEEVFKPNPAYFRRDGIEPFYNYIHESGRGKLKVRAWFYEYAKSVNNPLPDGWHMPKNRERTRNQVRTVINTLRHEMVKRREIEEKRREIGQMSQSNELAQQLNQLEKVYQFLTAQAVANWVTEQARKLGEKAAQEVAFDRDSIRAVFERGQREFLGGQFQQCIGTMQQVKRLVADARALPVERDSEDHKFFKSISSSADEYIAKSTRAIAALEVFNEASSLFKSFKYDACITKLDQFLSEELEDIGLGGYRSIAGDIKRKALECKELREKVESLFEQAGKLYESLKLREALPLYLQIVSLDPVKVGLRRIYGESREFAEIIQETLAIEEEVNGILPNAIALFENRKYLWSKSIFLDLKNIIEEAYLSNYFSRQSATIEEYLRRIEEIERTTPILSLGNITVSPDRVLPGGRFAVSGNFTLTNVPKDKAISVGILFSAEGCGKRNFAGDGVSSGTFPFSVEFSVPKDMKPGSKVIQVVINTSGLTPEITHQTGLSFTVSKSGGSLLEQIAGDSRDSSSRPGAGETPPEPVKPVSTSSGMVDSVTISPSPAWVGDTINVAVKYRIFGVPEGEKIPVSISTGGKGLSERSASVEVSSGTYTQNFSHTIPKNARGGLCSLTVRISHEDWADQQAKSFEIKKAKLTVLGTSPSRRRIKRGESITLTGQVKVKGLRLEQTIPIKGVFSGSGMQDFSQTLQLGNETKDFTVRYSFPVDAKEGTYTYKFRATSELGGSTSTGTFVVGRSDKEVAQEQQRERQRQEEAQRRTGILIGRSTWQYVAGGGMSVPLRVAIKIDVGRQWTWVKYSGRIDVPKEGAWGVYEATFEGPYSGDNQNGSFEASGSLKVTAYAPKEGKRSKTFPGVKVGGSLRGDSVTFITKRDPRLRASPIRVSPQ